MPVLSGLLKSELANPKLPHPASKLNVQPTRDGSPVGRSSAAASGGAGA